MVDSRRVPSLEADTEGVTVVLGVSLMVATTVALAGLALLLLNTWADQDPDPTPLTALKDETADQIHVVAASIDARWEHFVLHAGRPVVFRVGAVAGLEATQPGSAEAGPESPNNLGHAAPTGMAQGGTDIHFCGGTLEAGVGTEDVIVRIENTETGTLVFEAIFYTLRPCE